MTFKAACPYCGNLVAVSPDQKTGILRSGVICDIDTIVRFGFGDSPFGKWRPSIHMPRWAARIILEITDVRVERVQDITTEGVKAEGLRAVEMDFIRLWDSIYYPSLFKWDANPWVWVIEYRRVKA